MPRYKHITEWHIFEKEYAEKAMATFPNLPVSSALSILYQEWKKKKQVSGGGNPNREPTKNKLVVVATVISKKKKKQEDVLNEMMNNLSKMLNLKLKHLGLEAFKKMYSFILSDPGKDYFKTNTNIRKQLIKHLEIQMCLIPARTGYNGMDTCKDVNQRSRILQEELGIKKFSSDFA